MIDPSVIEPGELALHMSGYAARLAECLEGNLPDSSGRSAASQPAEQVGKALKHTAQGLEFIRLSVLAATAAPSMQQSDKQDALAIATNLEQLMRRLDAIGTRTATA